MRKTSWLALALIAASIVPASANVITDWDDITIKTIQPPGPVLPVRSDLLFRAASMVHIAMFDAVDCIEPRYKPYNMQLESSPGTSQDAAAASAAAHVLMQILPNSNMDKTLADYLSRIPDGPEKDRGVRLGEAVAAKVVEMRSKDGSTARNAYRPVTQPGKYVPTAFTVGWQAAEMNPFVLDNAAQFRPRPPPDLTSDTWARDYNEIRELGEKYSTKRTPQQSDTARLWLAVGPLAYHPWVRQIVTAKGMDVVDSARFMALVAAAEADSIQSVYAAKWHYMFWRPMTAIRNGDIDNNPATERDATWEPLDNTPLHPEYPCAHCIASSAVVTIIQKIIGSNNIPDVAISTPTAPDVVHHFTKLSEINEEISAARIYAGFHYRNSTIVGTEMGRQIGDYVFNNAMQPLGNY